MKRIFFCAGEASGDIHGANLIRSLRAADPALACEGLGGKLMAAAGMGLRHDLAGEAVMGFTEVVKALRPLRRLFLDTVRHLARTKPDCFVAIDYPGFNIRLAKRAKALGIPVVYYISPQVWAWKRKRVHTIAKTAAKILVILPFEEELYRAVGADCTYVGHPLLDQVAATEVVGTYRGESQVIALLPGSREQEIRRLLNVMLDVAQGIRDVYPHARFVTPCVDQASEQLVRDIVRAAPREGPDPFPLDTVAGETYEVLSAARFCLVASGTATLETALFGVPMAIMYKTTALNHWLARRLVSVEHIGLANILAGRGIVPEFIQDDARAERILPAALELIGDTPVRTRMLEDLAQVRTSLGGPGASARAAAEILAVLEERGDD